MVYDRKGGLKMRIFYLSLFYISMFWKLLKISLNRKQRRQDIPENIKNLYNEKEYKRWIQYENETDYFSLFQITAQIIITSILILSPFYMWLSQLFPKHILLNSLFMMSCMTFFEELFELIENYYHTFVIEEKYGMNTTTLKIFFIDEIKSTLLSIILYSIIFISVHYLYQWFSYVGFFILFLVFGLIMILIQRNPLFLLKIYNQFTPLEEGPLKTQISHLVKKQGFELKGIYVMDASKRTKRANAFCSGQGRKKEISIDDNMFHQYTDEEILAVFCHELGHAVKNHLQKLKWLNILRGIIIFVLMIYVLLNSQLYLCFGIEQLNYYMIFVILGWILDPLMIILDIPFHALSRQCEYEADAFAVEQGYGEAFISVLKHLAKDSLADIQPHPLVVKLTYSHPPFSQRLKAVDEVYQK